MLPSSGAEQLKTHGPTRVLADSACTIAKATWPSPIPPHSFGMCGSHSPASTAFLRRLINSRTYSLCFSGAMSSRWPNGSIAGLMTLSTKSRTRLRISSCSGARVKSIMRGPPSGSDESPFCCAVTKISESYLGESPATLSLAL